MVILVLALGFPVALVLAWAYEITPEGIKPTENVDPGKSLTRQNGRSLDFVIIGVLVAVIAVMTFRHFHVSNPEESGIPEKA